MTALLGTLLAFPALRGTIEVDDYVHRSILLGRWPSRSVLLELFSFMPGPGAGDLWLNRLGFFPWWVDPDISVALLRPLTAATHMLDYWLWPDQFVLQHIHSLLWYFGGVLAVGALFRRVLPPAAAGLATLLFAVEDAHAMTAAWLANRNSLVALVFGVLAVAMHVRWRREGTHRHLAWALGLLTLGLLGAEAAVGAVAYVAAYQLTLDQGSWKRRLGGLAPYVALVLIWRLIYNAMGFGVRGSGLYIDPGNDPLGFLLAAFVRIPVLLLSQWTQAPVDLWMAMPTRLQMGLAAGGFACCVGLLVLFLPLLRTNGTCRFWALGMLFAAVPVSAAFPMDRLLLFVGIGAFGLIACLVQRVGWLGGESLGATPLRKLFASALLVLHIPLAICSFPFRSMTMMAIGDITQVMLRRLPAEPSVSKQTFVFINGMDVLTAYLPVIRSLEGTPFPRRTTLLASQFEDNEVTRVNARTLLIRPTHGFLAQDGDRLLRSLERPFRAGERVRRDDFEVTLMELTPDGRPAACQFVFDVDLDDAQLRWFAWVDGEIEPFAVPRVGETVVVEHSLLNLWIGREKPFLFLSTSGK